DGDVSVKYAGDDTKASDSAGSSTGGTSGSSPSACNDDAYNHEGHVESHVHQWYIKTSSIPTDLNQSTAVERIRDGMRNITWANNDCGRPDYVGARADYQGSTSRSAEIDSNANCDSYSSRDGYNVFDFGELPWSYVGYACWWYVGAELTESDVSLNSNRAWSNNPGTECETYGKFDIESVATHERGHTFGMGHVSETYHGNLTMSTEVDECDTRQRTLGLGDLLGLEVLYYSATG
ncbi:MAG: hypothetical protein M3198_02555, partial [Actinomycetota bacterium]|nr:hypothetical protein [Actinomycetota bacterium]